MDQSDIQLRKAVKSDLPSLHQLFRDSITKIACKDYNPRQIEVWATISHPGRWVNAIQEQYFLVAERNGQIAGFGSIDQGKYLDFLYVSPDHQKTGVAQAIYFELENEAKKLDSPKIFSDVSITAIPFFKRNGFQIERENKKYRQGVMLINYRMVKPLTKNKI